MGDDVGHNWEHRRNASADKIFECRALAAIRHMDHADAGTRLEQLAKQMRRGTDSG
jgi:hypothetical protein